MDNKKQKLEVELVESIKECCEIYFEDYNRDNKFRDAWLAVRKKRYQEIIDNGFYLDADAETFKNEVLKFWEGKFEGREQIKGYNFENSKIKKRSGEWIIFQDENGETPNSEKIINELNNNNLELHGNYSWSKLQLGVNHGAITDDMQELKETINYLFDENIDIAERFNRAMEITGMGHGKASMFLHIKYPDKYGVWNGCVLENDRRKNTAFKILKQFNSRFNIKGADNGKKYIEINEQLKWLLENYKKKKENSGYGFENLSDVDIFMWYVSNNFKLIDGKVFFKKLNKKIYV